MFTRIAHRASALAAHPIATSAALLLFVAWLIATIVGATAVTTVITGGATVGVLTVVFLLQRAQHHDTRALHTKIDELILNLEGARDELAGVEHRTLEELDELRNEASD